MKQITLKTLLKSFFFENDSASNENRLQNITIVTDELHKEYVSQLKNEKNNVNLVTCKNLSFDQLDLSGQS